MNKKQLLKEIDEWMFSECPTKTANPFFWRWTKKGEEQLVEYIIELLKAERKEIIKVCKELEYSDGCSGQSRDCGSFKYNQALQDIIKSLK